MKTKLTLKCTAACLLFATLGLSLSTLFAQGTAFTYQGRLNDGTNPANGNYDLKFTLFNTNTSGSLVAGPLTNSPTAVTNGLFTVVLDFGNVFPGADRWLEIAVRTNGGSTFATLSPRQKLTPTPYAIYAANAAQVGGQGATAFVAKAGDTMTGALNLPPNGLNVGSGQLVASGGNVGIGTVNPIAPLHVLSTAQTPLEVSGGNTAGTWFVLINTSSGGHEWEMISTGSANGEGPGKLLLRDPTQGVVVTLSTNGNVGIGTTTPAAKLDVNGTLHASGVISAVGGLVIETRTGSDPSPAVPGQIWLRTDLP